MPAVTQLTAEAEGVEVAKLTESEEDDEAGGGLCIRYCWENCEKDRYANLFADALQINQEYASISNECRQKWVIYYLMKGLVLVHVTHHQL